MKLKSVEPVDAARLPPRASRTRRINNYDDVEAATGNKDAGEAVLTSAYVLMCQVLFALFDVGAILSSNEYAETAE